MNTSFVRCALSAVFAVFACGTLLGSQLALVSHYSAPVQPVLAQQQQPAPAPAPAIKG